MSVWIYRIALLGTWVTLVAIVTLIISFAWEWR